MSLSHETPHHHHSNGVACGGLKPSNSIMSRRAAARPLARLMSQWNSLSMRLFQPVLITPLVFLRICFGLIMLWEVWAYFQYDRISRYYIEPLTWFSYYGFDMLRPLPPQGMFALFHLIGLLSLCVALGVFYRAAMFLLWLCFTYVFLLDQAQYLNHFYLISLLCLLMIFIPAHTAVSFDAWRNPTLRSRTAPRWSLWLVRGQMTIVYVYGGIAKLNGDWLRGEPMRLWMSQRTDFPLLGGLFREEWMVALFSYGGLLFDLLIVPLLLWRRTRIPALIVAVGFHLTNSQLFNIGVFPWLAIAITLLFLPPHWFGILLPLQNLPERSYKPRRIVVGLLGLYFFVQILIPLRHFVYPGDVNWNEEGHPLAWHMRLRDKEGQTLFFVTDPATGTTWEIDPLRYISPRQKEQMAHRPDMILQFAHFLDAQMKQEGREEVYIFVWSMISLNTRPPQLLIDPTVDLSREPRDLLSNRWVLPLMQPLKGAPHHMLLITHQQGHLVLVNMGSVPFPLGRLTLKNNEQSLSFSQWASTSLEVAGCLLAVDAPVYVACNQVGTLPDLNGPFEVFLDDRSLLQCDDPCVVALPTE